MMAKIRLLSTVLTTAFISLSVPTYSEVVYVPIGQQGSEKQSMERPSRGLTKDEVQDQFGEPKDWNDPVGKPPISSWVYENFTVYFENDYVIHSVLTHSPNSDIKN